jgi:hypothetical protein
LIKKVFTDANITIFAYRTEFITGKTMSARFPPDKWFTDTFDFHSFTVFDLNTFEKKSATLAVPKLGVRWYCPRNCPWWHNDWTYHSFSSMRMGYGDDVESRLPCLAGQRFNVTKAIWDGIEVESDLGDEFVWVEEDDRYVIIERTV